MKCSEIPELLPLLTDKPPAMAFTGVQCDSRRVRPGDLFVKGGTHTVLFLYYTDASKSTMMLIHQGGEYSTSHCLINRNYDREHGYVARRQITFK